jgi:hypothetical protein
VCREVAEFRQVRFQKRLEYAHADYAESLETDFDNWVHESKHNTQIARISRLKAEWPEKYREEVKVLNAEAPIRMLEMLKELRKKELEAEGTPALESLAVEGEYRDIAGQGQEPTAKAPPPRTEPGLGQEPQPQWSPQDRRAAQVRATRGARRRGDKQSGPPPREVYYRR